MDLQLHILGRSSKKLARFILYFTAAVTTIKRTIILDTFNLIHLISLSGIDACVLHNNQK